MNFTKVADHCKYYKNNGGRPPAVLFSADIIGLVYVYMQG